MPGKLQNKVIQLGKVQGYVTLRQLEKIFGSYNLNQKMLSLDDYFSKHSDPYGNVFYKYKHL